MCENPNRTQMLISESNSTRNKYQNHSNELKKKIIMNLSNIGK